MDADSFIIHVKTDDVYEDMLLKKYLIRQVMKTIDHCLQEKIKK